MSRSTLPAKVAWSALVLAAMVAPAVDTASAQASGGDYTLGPVVSPAGGGSTGSGVRSATATIGQFDTGQAQGGAYVFRGGFWRASESTLFSNGFE